MSDLSLFSDPAFALLEQFSHDPRVRFYVAHRPELKMLIEDPFRQLMGQAAARLPALMRARLETRRNVFSRFLKNDFGQGGAWAHYWGAFYPLGGRRTADVQLAVWMDASLLQISFYVGDYAAVPRARFLRNCSRYSDELLELLPGLFAGHNLVLARDWDTCVDERGKIQAVHPLAWSEWLQDPARGLFCLRVPFTRREAAALPANDLVDLVVRLHSAYFPLALCTMDENPMPLIRAYLKDSEGQ